jgi:hypothetical protein
MRQHRVRSIVASCGRAIETYAVKIHVRILNSHLPQEWDMVVDASITQILVAMVMKGFRASGRSQSVDLHNWLEVWLIGTRSNRDGIGARIKIMAGGVTHVDEAKGGMSYQAAHDPRLHFGLGDQTRAEKIEVRWPSGIVDKLAGVPANRLVTIREGSGQVESRFPPLRMR